jgi:hypothetical protein
MRVYRRYVMLEENRHLLAVLERHDIPCELVRRRYGDIESVSAEIFLYEDDPAFAVKCAALEPFDIFNSEGVWVSPAEEDAAAWHWLSMRLTGYPQPERGWRGAIYGSEGVCARCGHHGRAVAPVRLSRSRAPKRPSLFGVNWAHELVLVSDATRSLFERERVSGLRYVRPVLHGTGAPIAGVWQLDIETILPPAVRTEELVAEPCEPIVDEAELRPLRAMKSSLVRGPYCGRPRWNHPMRTLLTVRAAALSDAPDVVLTHEQFGSGASSNRLVLVRKRVRDLARAEKIAGAAFHVVAVA